MSGAKKASKNSETKLGISKHLHSTGKKRALARRKHRKLRVAADQNAS